MSNRAERRLAKKLGEPVQKEKTYTLTQSQIDQIRDEAREEAVDTAFILMLALPLEVLLGDDYWPKSAQKRLPKYMEDILSLYEAYNAGVLTLEHLREDLEKYGGITINIDKSIKHY